MPTEPVTMPVSFDYRARESYQVWVSIPIRFGDQDAMGHVNNAVIATYFEQARCIHILPMVVSPAWPELNIVLARIVIDYVQEIHFPGDVDVGIRLSRVGGKSFVVVGAIFSGNNCCAHSEATMVFFDTHRRCSTTPPEHVRERLRAMV